MTLSRMVGLIVAAIALPAQAEPMARYHQLTQVAVRGCAQPSSPNEIQVCGRRAADQWRLPLIGRLPGDPHAETVSMERNRLASAPKLKCGIGAILAGCGMVGVSVSTTSTGPPRFRTPAD
ncbi:hypothetical protein SPAN111604_06275 [Sphingomonas antarctica]|uniref:hypothetical protein n=1 Tax=Sphingomonas antarctica TaxID=2040274 RepID=UPI0039ECBB45